MSMLFRISALCLALLLLGQGRALAAPAPFDLQGPKLRVEVTRAGKTLPISEVPTLAVGDQIRIRADLPPGQSVHYLLVAAFLRGATNPPPDKWFFSSETWKKKRQDGLRIAVPEGAQQVIAFLAPETGGDFKAIQNAVRGRPGAFVRASQDLNQASLDRSRLDAFLAAIRKVDQIEPARLNAVSPLLARSLNIKLEAACLQQPPEARAACLMEGRDALVLDDGHSTSMVKALASGYSADLVQQLSATPKAGSGAYSPYVASILDIAHIMDAFRTAQYQYFPALVTQEDDAMSLLLNAPPSFQNPKSVLLAALPPIEAAHPPPLHPVDPGAVDCLTRPGLVLPVEGAPLVFSAGYAHHMALRVKGKAGQDIDLPVRADPSQGGFVVDASRLEPGDVGERFEGVLHGYWGFDPYEGPSFHLQNAASQSWRTVAEEGEALLAGRDGVLKLAAAAPACVESVALQQASGQVDRLAWRPSPPDRIEVQMPLKAVQPGALTLLIKTYAAKAADATPIQAFAPLGQFDGFTYHARDASGVLKGGRLDEVAGLTVGGVEFRPAGTPADGGDGLVLAAADPASVGKLAAGASAPGVIKLKDGRTVGLPVKVGPPRPSAVLVSRNVRIKALDGAGRITLGDADELPRGATLTFSLRAEAPAVFTADDRIEVATVNGAFSTSLTTAGGLILQDQQIALATLDTEKAFNASAAGRLQFRVVSDGVAGEWRPLATLVRLPQFRGLTCPPEADQPCELAGSNLFLIESLSTDAGFGQRVEVPPGFPGDSLQIPRPKDGELHFRLRDAPKAVNTVVFQAAGSPAA